MNTMVIENKQSYESGVSLEPSKGFAVTPHTEEFENIVRELRKTTVTLWVVLGICVLVTVLLINKTSDLSNLAEKIGSLKMEALPK
ncbi:MAG TPA: hypothetical protein ACFYD4_16700 [Candidatus Wunengus sp. YC61]|uniref:hypothetical protein n=1 Tax=Candidatus Wunengus sp. YC61 TaxID=3367698 RepID=UPI0040268A11